MYTHVHTCTHTHIHIRTHTHRQTHVYTDMHMHTHARTHTHVYRQHTKNKWNNSQDTVRVPDPAATSSSTLTAQEYIPDWLRLTFVKVSSENLCTTI